MRSAIAHLPQRSLRYLESPGIIGDEWPRGTRALVFIHAFPLSAEMWLPQLARVPAGWRFLAPDLRGFRGTTGIAYQDAHLLDATVDDYAADMLAFMDHLEIRQATVCGLSMGGYVAMAVAARAPQRVSALILADTRMTADTPAQHAGRDEMRDVVLRDGAPAAATRMLPGLLGPATMRDQPELADAVRALIEANRAEAIAGALGALKTRPDRSAVLAAYPRQALVLCGADDALTKVPESEAMARVLPDAQMVVIPDAGHLSNMEQPLAFNAALAAFLG